MSMVERQIRIQLALTQISIVGAEEVETFNEWLDLQPPEWDARTHYGMVFEAGAGRVRLSADGPPEIFIPVVSALLESMGDTDVTEQLTNAAQELDAGQVGSWVSVSEDGVDAGWSIMTATEAAQALDIVPASADREALGGWLTEHAGCELVELHQSLGEPDPQTELLIMLPESSAPEILGGIEALFTALDIDWFGTTMAAAIVEEGATDLALFAAFTPTGVSRLGIVVLEPERRITLLLAGLAAKDPDEGIAVVEAALGVEGPDQVSFVRDAAGWGSELYYAW